MFVFKYIANKASLFLLEDIKIWVVTFHKLCMKSYEKSHLPNCTRYLKTRLKSWKQQKHQTCCIFWSRIKNIVSSPMGTIKNILSFSSHRVFWDLSYQCKKSRKKNNKLIKICLLSYFSLKILNSKMSKYFSSYTSDARPH